MSNQTCEVIPVVKKVISEIENPDYQAQAMFWAANDHASRCELVEQAHTEALEMNKRFNALRNRFYHWWNIYSYSVRMDLLESAHTKALEMATAFNVRQERKNEN
ncbi:hypothetical protein [Citrobacter amalonaticus]|uniref:ANR family transcriptional regulator n=1 Tax=Citrobacter amalonaticus TaxID=35703 RepID=A0AAX2BQX2_CITAM|nr:hypothetical protein [Citrobacter amalonaticus]SBA34319.1 protein of unknown function [Citrobacter amalonaticus]